MGKIPTLRFATIKQQGSAWYAWVREHKRISSALGAVLVIGGYFIISSTQANTTLTLMYGKVVKGSVNQSISGSGQVLATSQVDLKPKVNANVTEVLVSPGAKVTKGQVLFRLDARDAYKQVRDASLALNQAEVALKKLTQPAESIDVLTLENAIKKIQTAKTVQDTNVSNAYANLLSSNLIAVPDISYTTETAPTITGTYLKKEEGQIKLTVNGGEGSIVSVSGLVSDSIRYSSSVAQPIGDTGLYIKFAASQSSVNWVIDVPNKRSSSYLSLVNAYNNAQQNRDIANADSDRQIAEYTQKLEDLKRGAKALDVEAQELSVTQRRNALNDANATLADYTITAPFSGTMASVSAQVGLSAVTAASNGATSLGTIVTDKRIAEITLNESDIAKIHIGQMANITFDALDEVMATGTVADIDGIGTVSQGVVTYKVKVYFETPSEAVKPNMSVSVEIITESKDGVLTVPTSAVKKDQSGYYVEHYAQENGVMAQPYNQGTSTRSLRVRENASTTISSSTVRRVQARTVTVPSSTVLTKIPVTIGVQGDTVTEVITGLSEGQSVIVKKVTGTTATKSQAPSLTSLFRPGGAQGQNKTQGATAATRTGSQTNTR